MDHSLPPLQIILAEDNPADVLLVREALSEHGVLHKLHVFQDGDSALKFIDELEDDPTTPRPALFLLDLHLPKRDGREILARVQSSRCAGAHVVIFIAPGDQGLQQLATASVHFFQKTPSLNEFLSLGQLVQTVLKSNEEIRGAAGFSG